MKRKRIEVVFVVALFAAALAFVACKNIEDGGEIQQPPAPEQGATGGSQGEGQPGGGDNTGNEGESPDEGQNQPSAKTVVELLKEIIGENEYDAISAEVAAGNLTLTAEKIKAVGDIFPALEKDAESGKEAKDVENAAAIRQNKEAFVAQNEGKIKITKSGNKYTFNYGSSELTVKFTGEFNLSEITLPTNNGKGDFDNATLKGNKIDIYTLNNIRGSSLPTLSLTGVYDNIYIPEITSFYLYKLYKDYTKDLSKLQISGDMADYYVDGRKDSNGNNINGYTLFDDNNTAKLSSSNTVKSLTIDAMVQMYRQLKIAYFVNMIISGAPTTSTTVEVNWDLTNIIFEDDMSKIENNGAKSLTGIVYFKKKVYNNIGRQSVDGLLKLDSLEGVSDGTFNVYLNKMSAVLDVRGVNPSSINSYNKGGILAGGGYAHAIYFSDSYSSYEGNEAKIKELCLKFSNNQGAGFINAYLGNTRVNGESYTNTGLAKDYSTIGAKTPRSLKEFEAFGNNSEHKFEKAARDTYNNDELSDFDKNKLNIDPYRIAQNNKSCFSCVAKTIV